MNSPSRTLGPVNFRNVVCCVDWNIPKNIGQNNIPLIVRLQGTNAEEAKKLIDDSGLEVQSVILLQEAADKVAEAVS